MKKVIGLGAGGHAKVIIDILNHTGVYEIVGLLDNNEELWNTSILGVPILGGDELLPGLLNEELKFAFIGLGSIGNSNPRRELYEYVKRTRFNIIQAIHPSANISSSVRLGEGVAVMSSVVINANVRTGKNVIINTGSIIEHDCDIGDHVHIASGSILAGGVKVDEGAHIGLGANVLQGVLIGKNSIIGAGTVVLKDVEPNTVVVGNPARVLKKMVDL